MAKGNKVLLTIVSTNSDMHSILKALILSKNVNLNLIVDSENCCNNYFIIHQFESEIDNLNLVNTEKTEDFQIQDSINEIEELCNDLDIPLSLDTKIMSDDYNIKIVQDDLMKIKASVGSVVEKINYNKNQIKKLSVYRENLDCIIDKTIELNKVLNMKYFECEIGLLSHDDGISLKDYYENISAVILKIGSINSIAKDIYMIIYPKQFEENRDVIKSLNWNKLQVPEELYGNLADIIGQIDKEIKVFQNNIDELSGIIELNREKYKDSLLKIYNFLKLEEEIDEISNRIDNGDNVFALNVWIQNHEVDKAKELISKVSNQFFIKERTEEEIDIAVPTKLDKDLF
ncbi:MAG: hypothetical protein SA378_09025 [Sedimentibacter sp.]|uniref:hypothetical protein n=1 Tax=Sedimentibacter sp. TaxID=1960295 RepID=UPI00298255EE|nr:hypothetical protein [Sedimentibacter sp.]MDW5300265.1 hypothetical protein [Sedimentibacter sp.]